MPDLLDIAMLGAYLLAPGPATAEGVPFNGCPHDFAAGFEPELRGEAPLRLVAVTCVEFDSGSTAAENAFVSPDGRRAAKWSSGPPWPVRIATLEAPGLVAVPNRVTFRNFANSALSGSPPDAAAWSSDSRSIWTVRQETASPSGFALSELRPIRIGLDGKVRPLPALRHPAGSLDGMMWVGGDGLALAQFGTRGDFYRPARGGPTPTFAMVDAARGRILAALAADRVPELRRRPKPYGPVAAGAVATVLPDGRIRSLLSFRSMREERRSAGPKAIAHPGLWLLWTEGEAPTAWLDPPAADAPMALSPDGSRLLLSLRLPPKGIVIVGCRIRCPMGRPPEPVSGLVAELVDLDSRSPLWRIEGKAMGPWTPESPPAISADGRHALIELPPEDGRKTVALVSMADGRVLQRILAFQTGSYPQFFGFARGGRQAWVACGNVLLTYRLDRR